MRLEPDETGGRQDHALHVLFPGGSLGALGAADESGSGRTFAIVHQHKGRLYIHQATAPAGMPQPILFMQNFGVVDEQGRHINYGNRRSIYVEGFSQEWRFPSPPPPRTVRDY